MGTEARIVLYAPSRERAEFAAQAAFERIRELDEALSDYLPDSDVSRVAARAGGDPEGVGRDLLFVLAHALALAQETDGAFDPTAGPVVRLWREARRTRQVPDSGAVRQALARVGWRYVELDTVAGTVRLALAGMQLDLGGIAKGHAADEALYVLSDLGVSRALVSVGGDIAAGRAPPGEEGWLVALEHGDTAQREVRLEYQGVSTSGATEQFLEVDGVRHSHIVDPRTGWALTSRIAVTVIAREAMLADAWATAGVVVAPQARAAFVGRRPEARFIVVE